MTRTVLHIAAGMVAGAALVGVPVYAVAAQGSNPRAEPSPMGQMMPDRPMRADMVSMMADMMRDPALRQQMRTVMSESMRKSRPGRSDHMPMSGHRMEGPGE